jgi:hypothetical protein
MSGYGGPGGGESVPCSAGFGHLHGCIGAHVSHHFNLQTIDDEKGPGLLMDVRGMKVQTFGFRNAGGGSADDLYVELRWYWGNRDYKAEIIGPIVSGAHLIVDRLRAADLVRVHMYCLQDADTTAECQMGATQ